MGASTHYSHSEGEVISWLSEPHHLHAGEEGALIVEPSRTQAAGPGMDAWGRGKGEGEGGVRGQGMLCLNCVSTGICNNISVTAAEWRSSCL